MPSSYVWQNNERVNISNFIHQIENYRALGKKIVTTNGCFDILHTGHLRFLEEAKSLGDILIVGLNSDSSVKQIKGPDRPINAERDRAVMLAALAFVDHVFVFDDPLPNNFLETIKPNIHCKAGDYEAGGLPEAPIVKKYGGEIRILPMHEGYSTSKMIQRIYQNNLTDSSNNSESNLILDQNTQIMDHFLNSGNVLRQVGYQLADRIKKVALLLDRSLNEGNKILICGNGGSAADSQHFAAELVVKYKKNRGALPAMALTTDTSIITASGNDFGYEKIFSRQVEAFGRDGDVLIAISTSGTSPNIIEAILVAKNSGIKVIGLTGRKSSRMVDLVDECIAVPSEDTALIQQAHIAILHMICDLIEQNSVKD